MKKLAQKKATARKTAVKRKVAAKRQKIREEVKSKKLLEEIRRSMEPSITIRNPINDHL